MRLPETHLCRPSLSLPRPARRSTPRRTRRLSLTAALIVLLGVAVAVLGGLGPGAGRARAASAQARGCSDADYPATRDPANPLMLAHTPSDGDVLQGANFFVPGPARGPDAGAIAQLLGIDRGQALESGLPLRGFSDSESYAAFAKGLTRILPRESASVQRRVRLLEMIAREPSPMRISSASGGGSPAAIYTATRNMFCQILRADPHSVPIVTTYFLHPELGNCASVAQITADVPRFLAQIRAMAAAIGRRPIVLFDELDAVGSSVCMAHEHSIGAWEDLVGAEAAIFESLPHTAVYLEGGYSDSDSPAYAAQLLSHMDIHNVQGFYTNDTHLEWTAKELRYAEAISRRLGGVHFVINTSSNGRGPLLNAHPRTEGIEDLCNAPGRGLGIPDTTTAQNLSSELDGLLWVVPPGASSGSCNGGPPSGEFWPARAEALAANANRQLGPGSRSEPY